MVEYTATFQLVKPVDMTKASHLMWHDVPNRGGRLTIVPAERATGDIGLSSGWQGDAAGRTVPGPNNDYVVVPVAKNPDGSAITGQVMARIINASGKASQPMHVYSNPMPYKPASLDTKEASLTTHASETIDGQIGATAEIAPGDWAFAKCDADHPFPGTPDPTQICLKNGFDPNLLYQVVFTAKDPPVLGIGFAAFRDVGSFFKYAPRTMMPARPIRSPDGVNWAITRGVSQSGNFVRGFLHFGFNQDEAGRKLYDGAWPIIAGRRIALNIRFATPDGVSRLYEPGSEGPQWWGDAPDPVRGLPSAGILDRCNATNTCPKIIEHFGAAEVWGLKLSPEWVGLDGRHRPAAAGQCAALLHSVARSTAAAAAASATAPAAPPACPEHRMGQGHAAQQSGAAHPDGECAARAFPQLGDEGHRAAAEPLSDPEGRRAGRRDRGGDGLPGDSRPAGARADRPHQSGDRLRFRSGLRSGRRLRRRDHRAAAHQACRSA